MEEGCGIYRTAQTMQATCDKLAELKQRFRRIALDDHSKGWNTEWLLAIELGYLLDGDEVTLSAWCERPGHRRIGLGHCVGRVLPAREA